MNKILWGVVLSLFVASTSNAAMLMADGNQRPSSITDFDVDGTLYDITFHFDDDETPGDFIGSVNFANPVALFTELQFDNITTAIEAMLQGMLAPTPDSSLITIHLATIPSTSNTLNGFDSQGRLLRNSGGSNWTPSTMNVPDQVEELSPTIGSATFALAASSAVPEPSSFALLGMATLGALAVYRRKQRNIDA